MFDRICLILDFRNDCRKIIICIVYLSFFLDNMLLTMIVPIMPDLLMISVEKEKINNQKYQKTYRDIIYKSQDNKSNAEYYKSSLEVGDYLSGENDKLGFLLSSKAVVQLGMNPLIGIITTKVGYYLPLFFGTCSLFISALTFAFGTSYLTLFLARSLQGVASSCIGITGMCLVAEKYPEEPNRSKMIGIVLGSVAFGVLTGYPFGGFIYDCVGKSAPFLIILLFIFADGVLQLKFSDLKPTNEKPLSKIVWIELLKDKRIFLIGGAIVISTSSIAILEPCLPIWLLKEMKPEKWQVGTAFIPDSLGYVIGTNGVGLIAYQIGRMKIALPAMILIGLSTFLVPVSKSMAQLIVPHFFIGFGIGAVDAALIPLLASLVDKNYSANYGSVYAMQQMSVSLAYSLGPVLGSKLARIMGFPWMMRILGLLNIFYSPFLLFLNINNDEEKSKIIDYEINRNIGYQEFSDSESSK